MAATTYVNENTRAFNVGTGGALDGKIDLLVELDPATPNGVMLLATPGNEIGVIRNELSPGAKQVSVRLLGKDGTVRLIQNGAIARGARVVADSTSPGRVKTQPTTTGTYLTIGRKLSAGPGVANEVIEVLDAPQTIIVP